MKTQVKAEVTTITPEIAMELLENNDHNRKVSQANIRAVANALQNNEWQLNGQPIIVAEDGKLMDGQHRLMAVIETQISLPTVLVTGVREEVFTTIDTGRVRTGGDTLSIAFGLENPSTMANLIKMYHGYINCRMTKPPKLSNTQILNLYRENEELFDDVYHDGILFRSEYHAKGIFSKVEWMLIALIKKDLDRGSEFIQALLEGEFPVFEKQVNIIYKNGKNATQRAQVWHGFFKTYNKWLKDEPETLKPQWWDVLESKHRAKPIAYPHLSKCKV